MASENGGSTTPRDGEPDVTDRATITELTDLPPFPWYELVHDSGDVLAVRRASGADSGAPTDHFGSVVAVRVLDRAATSATTRWDRSELAVDVFDRVRPGGEAWFSVRNRFSVLHGIDRSMRAPRLRTESVRSSEAANRTTTLSRRGYRRVLEAAGFTDVEVMPAFFDADDLDFVATRQSGNSLTEYLRTVRYSRSRPARFAIGLLGVLDRLGVLDDLAPAFVIGARRPDE